MDEASCENMILVPFQHNEPDMSCEMVFTQYSWDHQPVTFINFVVHYPKTLDS